MELSAIIKQGTTTVNVYAAIGIESLGNRKGRLFVLKTLENKASS